MDESVEVGQDQPATLNRRNVLKGAAAVGAAAFASPVIAGVFQATSVQAFFNCDPVANSRAIPATTISGQEWNSNSASGYPFGRYNGQNRNFTLPNGATGFIRLGSTGVDNFDTRKSYYEIVITGYDCTATFALDNCGTANLNNGLVCQSTPGVAPGPGIGSLPYCAAYYKADVPAGTCATALAYNGPADYTDPNVQISLLSIVCCPL